MIELHAPWLELAILLPLLAAMVCYCTDSYTMKWAIASTASALVVLVTVVDWFDFSSLQSFEAHDPHSLVQSILGHEFVVVDEFNAPLLTLASALYFTVTFSTPRSKWQRFPFGLSLLSLTVTLTLFSCRSPETVFTLIAVGILLPWRELVQRGQPPHFFLIYQLFSVLLLFSGWFLLMATDLGNWLSQTGIALATAGLLIRCGCIPFHSWQHDFFQRSSLGTALLLATPMTGAYGLVRVIIPIAPTWLLECVSLLSLATAIYASGMVLVQNTMRGFYCFLLLSYTSLILVGLESLSRVGLTGSLSLWLSVGISMISLGLVMRAVESRVGRISLTHYSGLYGQMPWLGGCFLLAVLSSIGFPGTVGFIGVELLVDSALVHNPLYAATIVLTLAINGIGALRVYFRIFAGPTTSATLSLQPKFTERTIFLALALLIIAGGLFPQSGIGTRYHAAREILLRRGQLYDLHAQPAPTDSSLSP